MGAILTREFLRERVEESHEAVAREVGCSSDTVRNWRIRHGFAAPLDPELAAEATRLRRSGASLAQTAAELGCSRKQVQRLLLQAEAAMRREGPRGHDGCSEDSPPSRDRSGARPEKHTVDLSRIDAAWLAEAYRERTVAALLEQLGIPEWRLYELLDRHGIPRRRQTSSLGRVLTREFLIEREGWTNAEIAREVGCAWDTARDWRIRHGLSAPLDWRLADRVRGLYAGGASIAEIVERLGCSRNQVWRLLRQTRTPLRRGQRGHGETPKLLALRWRAQGNSISEIARRLRLPRHTVGNWISAEETARAEQGAAEPGPSPSGEKPG